MTPFIQFIDKYLDPIGIVMGLLMAIPVLWTWYELVFGRRRRHQQYLAAIRKAPGERPAVLIIDLLPGRDIRVAVENYCHQSEKLREVSRQRTFHLRRDGVGLYELDKFKQELRDLIREMYAQGVDRIHYFHAGPGMVSAVVGAELANGCPVWLYQYEGSRYQSFGLLKLPAVLLGRMEE